MTKSLFSVVALALALVQLWSIMELLGRPVRRWNPEQMRRVHRVGGYAFLVIYAVVSFYCLKDYAAAGGDFSPRGNIHAVLAVVLFLVLAIKILVIRVYKQWKGLLLGYGMTAFVLATVMILSSAGWYLLVSKVGKAGATPNVPRVSRRGASAPALPVEMAAQAGDASKGKVLYQQHCAPCHGTSGNGDGPGAAALPVKPRKHTDGVYMNALSDAHLKKVITQGGAAVGKSGMMPGWVGALSEKDVEDVIAHLRTLAVPPYKAQ